MVNKIWRRIYALPCGGGCLCECNGQSLPTSATRVALGWIASFAICRYFNAWVNSASAKFASDNSAHMRTRTATQVNGKGFDEMWFSCNTLVPISWLFVLSTGANRYFKRQLAYCVWYPLPDILLKLLTRIIRTKNSTKRQASADGWEILIPDTNTNKIFLSLSCIDLMVIIRAGQILINKTTVQRDSR